MSDCEIGTRFAAAAVDERLLLRGELAEEPRDGVYVGEGLKEARPIFPRSAEEGFSADRGPGGMNPAVGAASVFPDGVGESRVRSGCALTAAESGGDGRVLGGNGAGVAVPKRGDGAIKCASKQSRAGAGSFGEGSEEATKDRQECGRTAVSPWHAQRSEASGAPEGRGSWMHDFEVGDMVWGKVKSHPWWPGHIFNEAFATSSVRRMRRDGHALVAFFGDSSYGWFDPSELVPFDSHYAEKSKQTTSRTFIKAVEEAVDESNRRCALGLSCRCRNPSNFRPTFVSGYFVVDVAGYEPGGVYSSKQIKKARDDFATREMLSFVNNLAVRPYDPKPGNIGFIKKSTTILALRKAMFEEFDVTYAEAFGVQPVLPLRSTLAGSYQNEQISYRAAPLSGPLVIAEALGERQASGKAVVRAKVPAAKKNKYLFKRREEPASAGLKAQPRPSSAAPVLQHAARGQAAAAQLPPGVGAPGVRYLQADVVVAAADGSYAVEVGNYVLQKRAPEKHPGDALTKQEEVGTVSLAEISLEDKEAGGKAYPSAQDDVAVKPEQPGMPAREGIAAPPKAVPGEHKPVAAGAATDQAAGTSEVAAFAAAPPPMDAEAHHQRAKQIKLVIDGVKKEKIRKHPADRLDGEEKTKKKKRKIKEGGREAGADHPAAPKHKKSEEPPRSSSAGRSIGVGWVHPDNSFAETEKVDTAHGAAAPPLPAILHQLPKLDVSLRSLDTPAILDDLSALALDPFYGSERHAAAVVLHVFLRFRSLVYEKALPFPPTGEQETPEPQDVKCRPPRPPQEAARRELDRGGEAPRDSAKPPKMKSIPKPDDPAKTGRKRLPSDRQEEKLAKRLRKLDKLKALASEKKAGVLNRTADAPPRGEQGTAAAPARLPKSDSVKKHEASSPAVQTLTPTYLVMKFPQRSTLPSISTLKARFARFGPLDLSGTKVLWRSYTCTVLFKHISDAQSAYNYAQENDIFGQMKVTYSLQDFDSADGNAADPSKRPAVDARPEDAPPQQFRPGVGVAPAQLKSILKKPSADEAAAPVGGGGVVAREAPRVKFMLVGDEAASPAVVGASVHNGGGGNAGGNGILPTPAAAPLVDINLKAPRPATFLQPLHPPLQAPFRPQVVHRVPLQPPLVPRAAAAAAMPDTPLPPRAPLQPPHKAPLVVPQAWHAEVDPRDGKNGADISRQMLSLLAQCSEVVSAVASALGYLPYHPL